MSGLATSSSSHISLPLVGSSNESEIIVNGTSSKAVIDTGSMISTIGLSFFKSLKPLSIMSRLSDFSLDISSANGSKVPYLGYSLLDISFPSISSQSFSVPILIVPDTDFSCSVPFIIGTNVLNVLKSFNTDSCTESTSSSLSYILASLPEVVTKPVTLLRHQTVIVKPFETTTLEGKVRHIGNMSSGVTESTDSLLNVCPRLVKLQPGSSFCRVPVRVCNLTAGPISIHPRMTLCNLHDVSVVRTISPSECVVDKSHNADKSLDDLSISIPTDTLYPEQQIAATSFFNQWKHISLLGLLILV